MAQQTGHNALVQYGLGSLTREVISKFVLATATPVNEPAHKKYYEAMKARRYKRGLRSDGKPFKK